MFKYIDDYLNREDWRIHENANRIWSIGGLKTYIAEHAIAKYTLEKVYPKRISECHIKGYMHIHDLCHGISGYCAGWSLRNLLYGGFNGVPGTTYSTPAKHMSSALGQMMNFLGVVQQEWAGAQAFSSLDTLLAPYVYYDNLSYEQVKQCLQEFVYNLNVTLRYGNERPFTNLSFDLNPPSDLKDNHVIIAGEIKEETYGDFQDEMDIINKAFLEVMYEGDGLGNVFSFPIPTYNITKDFDWDNEVGELLAKVTAKFGIPYFQNCIGSGLSPELVRAMCCFSGQTEVIWRKNGVIHITTFQRLHQHHNDETIETLFNGRWVKANVIQIPYSREFYRITLRNGVVIDVTDDHLHVTKEGIKKTSELTTDDYLAWSSNEVSEWEGVGNYEFGYFLGLYLAEGSKLGTSGIQFSIGYDEDDIIDFIKDFAINYLGCTVRVFKNKGHSKSVMVYSKWLLEFIDRWIAGESASTKKLKDWMKLSKEALIGLFNGWMRGDGSRDEIYTSSRELAKQMMYIANIIGLKVNLRVTSRTAKFGDKEYTGDIYTIHICVDSDNGGRIYYSGDKYYYVKIESIEKYKSTSNKAYCFVVHTDEHLFELPHGLITHNCRLQLDKSKLRRMGGLFGNGDLTGSIGVVTLNMPKLAYESKDEDEFLEKVEQYMELAKESLEIKRRVVLENLRKGLMPYSKVALGKLELRNHFSTIGLVGMNEACLNLIGEDIASKDGLKLAKKTLEFMRDKTEEYTKETGNLYNLEATPAEGCCYRLAKIDKSQYKDIITAGTDEAPYYTNSTYLPVKYDNLLFALNHQSELQPIYTGGTVFHVFVGESPPADKVPKLVMRICENTPLPYISITPTFSICPKHGYLSGEHHTCPSCGSECLVYSRIVGYLRPTAYWNTGKKQEFVERGLYKVV